MAARLANQVRDWLVSVAPAGRPRSEVRRAPGELEPLGPWSHTGARLPDDRRAPVVAVLTYRGVSSTEVELVGDALARPLAAEVRLVSADGGPVVAVEPARQLLTEPLEAVPEPFGLVVPGGLAWKLEAERPEVVEWLGRVARTARGVLAVSTGSLLLASVGVLADRDATGHWLAGDLLAGLGARPSSARIVHGRLLATTTGHRAGVEAAAELAREMRFAPR
ncbi:MAG: DJ-1/PfpI family protein [Actinomycetota bacterium]